MFGLIKQHFISLLSGLIFIIIFQWYINPSGFYNLLFCFGALVLFYSANKKEKLYKHQNYIIITLALCMAYAVCAFAHSGSVNINILVKIIISSLLAYALLFNKINTLYMKIAHIYIALSCIFLIMTLGRGLFENASINAVSIFVIILASTINFIELNNSQNISFTPAIVSVIACLFGDSRNGITTSVIYLAIILVLTWHNTTKYHRLIILLILISSIYYISSNLYTILDLNIFARLENRGLLDLNQREVLWQGYFNEIDLQSLIFGVDYNDVPEIASFGENNNPHSSFIQVHNKYGIIGLGLLLSLILLLIKMLKNRQYAISIIILAVMARAFTDSVFFVGMFDYFVFMTILLFDSRICKRFILMKQTKVKKFSIK